MLDTLEKVYQLLARIPVSGNHVEELAAARELLRNLYQQVEQSETNVQKEGAESGCV